MNSSTSSFKSELKVLLFVAAVLAASELGVRFMERSLSLDLRHIRELPEIAARLKTEPAPRVLLLGNSLTREGVNLPQFKAGLQQQLGAAPGLETAYPDASDITIWLPLFRHHFVNSGSRPEVVVLGFGEKHLQDNRRDRATVLGAFYTGLEDTPQVFREDVKGFDERCEFLLAKGFASFANRSRISPRILDRLIPHYREGLEFMQMVRERHAYFHDAPEAPTYERLERLVELAKASNIRLVLVALPISKDYELNDAFRKVVAQHQVTLLDCRKVAGLNPDMFPDGLHMGREASEIFTRELLRQMGESVPEFKAGVHR